MSHDGHATEDRPLHLVTPLIHSDALSQASGCDVWAKLDNLQTPGSFKIRGIGLLLQRAVRKGAKRAITSSGGNAGLAAAWAGRKLGIPVTVVIPTTISEFVIQQLQKEQAEVIVHGKVWDEANAHALSLLSSHPGAAYVHPFDEPTLWEGHSSVINELDFKPDAFVTVVGGGGLLCGVLEGLKRRGWEDVPVVAVETEGAASFHVALSSGHPVPIPGITSIAKSLGALSVCPEVVTRSLAHLGGVHSVLVNDRDAVAALSRFADEHRMLVGPACAAGLAVVYGEGAKLKDVVPGLTKKSKVVVMVCGGTEVSVELVAEWRKTFGV